MQLEEMSILVVDDFDDIHGQLKIFLESANLKNLYFAHSISEACEILGLGEGMAPNCSIDLILMDIEMPIMDGIEGTRKIKAAPEFTDIPVLMITGDTSNESLQAAYEAGAVDYITKPFKKGELLARVRSFLKLKAEIDARKTREKELKKALAQIKTLKGFIPICASCKNIRKDDGYWQKIESYITEHSEALFTHSICPDCSKKYYKELQDTQKCQ